ncbi:MAG: hypothetical protein JO280_15845 [Mycobacteriaceae bacterium]|nr:hypothetical protein [Mycobacteriaceae bacterium]
MIILGIILVVAGLLLHLHILTVIGAILVVVGIVFHIFGAVGRPVAGRRVWF